VHIAGICLLRHRIQGRTPRRALVQPIELGAVCMGRAGWRSRFGAHRRLGLNRAAAEPARHAAASSAVPRARAQAWMRGAALQVAGGLHGELQSTGLPLPGAPGWGARPPFTLARDEVRLGSLKLRLAVAFVSGGCVLWWGGP
jgi:hypothetical protein